MLYIFDKDMTLVHHHTDEKFINNIADQVLMPNVAEKCAKLREAGHTLAIASNQGDVAFGIMTEEEAEDIVRHAADLIQASAWAMCPHHPDGTIAKYAIKCKCRKPGPNMIFQFVLALNYTSQDIIFIGDMETDRQAAQAAGVEFRWANEFFNQSQETQKILKEILTQHNVNLWDIDEIHPRPKVDLLEAEGDTPQAKANFKYLENLEPVSVELRCGCRWSHSHNWFQECDAHAP